MKLPLLTFLAPALLPAAAAADGLAIHGPYMHGHSWSGRVFGPVMMILFVGLIVALAVFALRALGAMRSRQNRPLQILEERFARGEIDAEEFAARRHALAD